MDNLGNTGMHMMNRSGMMMGSKLDLQQLSENATGPDAKFRWTGNMLGYSMDFTVAVTKWIKDKEKVWETIGTARVMIFCWYQMRLLLSTLNDGTLAELSISYERATEPMGAFLSLIFAPWYANWCLKNMLEDSKKNLEQVKS